MALPILFSPAIGEALHITISEARTSTDTLTLVFKASLGAEDYTRVAKGHIRVQLWSNLPATSSGPQDPWTAFDFQVASDERLCSSTPDGRLKLSASSPRWVNLAVVDKGTQPATGDLVLEIPVDLSTFSGDRRYGFTYRIVYGDGGIVWLGTHGRDGVVVLTGTKLAGVELGEGWKPASDVGGQGLVCDVQDCSVQGQGIAKLSNIGDYRIWSFDKNQTLHSPSSACVQGARSLVILPRNPGLHQFNEPAYVLSTSGSTLLSVSLSTGIVTSTGIGAALLQTCYDPKHLSTLVPGALAYSGMTDKVRVVKAESWILLLSPREQSPAKGLFIPTSSSPKKQNRITLDFAALAEILTSPLKEVVPPEFCIFSPSTNNLEYVDTRRSVELFAEDDTEIGFGVPSYGGEFALSRVYDLTDQEEDSKCKVALLSAHDFVTTPQHSVVVKPIILPTPPPSPFLNHRNARSTPTVTFSPDPVVIPRVDTVDIGAHLPRRQSGAFSEPTKELETHTDHQIPPSSKGSELQHQSEGSTSTAIRRRGLLSLFKGIISLVRIYTGAVFYLFYFMSLGPLFGRRSRAPETPTELSSSVSAGAVEDDTEIILGKGVDELASARARFDVGKGESGEESDDSDEASSDVTVTGSDEQNSVSGNDEKSTSEPSPALEGAKSIAPHPEQDPSHDELLSAELHPTRGQSSEEVWTRLVLMTKDGSDSVSLSSLSKSITVNGNIPDSVVFRTLKAGGGTWAYHFVEFPLLAPFKTPTLLKVLNHA